MRGGGGASSGCRRRAGSDGTARQASAWVSGALVASHLPFAAPTLTQCGGCVGLCVRLFSALLFLHPLRRARPSPPTTPQDDGEIYCVSGKVPPTGLPLTGADVDSEVRPGGTAVF